MTLCDCECSNNNMASGYRKRSYSSTSTYNEPSFCGGSGQLQCSHSNISGCRQRSASIGSTVPNPLHQSHRMSIQYWKSAFTFLNTKGKFVCSTVWRCGNPLPTIAWEPWYRAYTPSHLFFDSFPFTLESIHHTFIPHTYVYYARPLLRVQSYCFV